MVQILSILALSTRAKGEENLATGARNLEIAHHVDDKVTMIEEVHWDVVHDIVGNVKARACLRHSRYFTENCDVGCEPLELSSCHLEDRALQSLAYNWAWLLLEMGGSAATVGAGLPQAVTADVNVITVRRAHATLMITSK